MNGNAYLLIAPLINDCPNCKNKFVGKDQGALIIEENIIERTCKCGFKWKHDVNEGVNIKKLKKEIKESVETFRTEGV